MTPKHWHRLILILIVVTILFGIGLFRIEIDSDIVASLPEHDLVISDAIYIFKNHPVQDQLFIDVSHQKDDLEILLECGELVEKKLTASGLFKNVGLKDVQNLMPDLMAYIIKNLPVMFSAKELEEKIGPMLETDEVQNRLQAIYLQLLEMSGIGQAEFMAKDPLGLKDVILARLAHLAPSQNARIYRGQLVSADGKHLLVIANPIASATDTTFARKAAELINNLSDELNRKYSEAGYDITLTPTGAYRAALDAWRDNPDNFRRDPQWRRELDAVSHRPYGTGFLFDNDRAFVHAEDSLYRRDCDFVGIVRAAAAGLWLVEGRNRIRSGDRLEIIGPGMRQAEMVFTGAFDSHGGKVETVQPNAMVHMPLPEGTQPGDLLRRWHAPAA